MKYLGWAVVFLSAIGMGALEKPLLVKVSGGGHLHPEVGGFERCEVYTNRVMIIRQVGQNAKTAFNLTEKRVINIKGNLLTVISEAAKEELFSKPNNLCDGPSTTITATQTDGQALLLFTTGGCGTAQKERTGWQSQKLKTLVDAYCPLTYKASE